MTNEYMLSTIDNPFNPFTQWDDWLRYDEDKKYYFKNLEIDKELYDYAETGVDIENNFGSQGE